MNNCCICWFFAHIFTGVLIFKGLTARRLYKSFGVKGLICHSTHRVPLTRISVLLSQPLDAATTQAVFNQNFIPTLATCAVYRNLLYIITLSM
jgi:hypothetical protein